MDPSIKPHPADTRKTLRGILRVMDFSDADRDRENTRIRAIWDREADGYDRQIGWWERRVFGEGQRAWACARAEGSVLEVAVGTGLNLPLYADGQSVVGIDLSAEMLAIARRRAGETGRDVELREGDAHELPFDDGSFDSVLATYSLCNIPDTHRALAEMHRVLRPGGRLVLVDHIRSSVLPILWLQRLAEIVALRMVGDHLTRRPSEHLEQHGFRIAERGRFRAGIVERILAVKMP